MTRTVAVTTDFSNAAGEAFAAAAAVARRKGECVSVLHVIESPEIFTPWQVSTPLPDDADHRTSCRRLEEIVRSEPAFAGLDVQCHALCGSGPAAVREFEAHADVDLVVIASNGSDLPGRPPLGHFAARVVNDVECPVLVFRSEEREFERVVPGSFCPRRILVPHDFSSSSCAGVEIGLKWAEDFDAQLHLVHALAPRSSHAAHRDEPPDRDREAAEDRLRSLLARHHRPLAATTKVPRRPDRDGLPRRHVPRRRPAGQRHRARDRSRWLPGPHSQAPRRRSALNPGSSSAAC